MIFTCGVRFIRLRSDTLNGRSPGSTGVTPSSLRFEIDILFRFRRRQAENQTADTTVLDARTGRNHARFRLSRSEPSIYSVPDAFSNSRMYAYRLSTSSLSPNVFAT